MWSAPAQYLVKHFISAEKLLVGDLTRPEVPKLPLFHNSPSCEVHSQENQGLPEDHGYNTT